MKKRALIGLSLLVLSVSLSGCKKEETPVETLPALEVIQPTEVTASEELNNPIDETKSMVIETVPPSVAVIGEDGEVLSEEEIAVKESKRAEEFERQIQEVKEEESLVEDNISSDISEEEKEKVKELESLTADEVQDIQDEMEKNVDELVRADAVNLIRETVKIDIKKVKDREEFSNITDEMIDSMSEEEISALSQKVIKAIRGY